MDDPVCARAGRGRDAGGGRPFARPRGGAGSGGAGCSGRGGGAGAAEGAIDAYYERDIKEYDWAAAALIAEEAGLTVQRPAFVGDLCHVRLV